MKGLTDRQQQILDYVEIFIGKNGMAPTTYELAKHFKITPATAFSHIRALQQKGYVTRSSKARSLSLLRSTAPKHLSLTLSIPLLGRISAGAPLLSEEHVEGHITYDPSFLPSGIGGHKLFGLKVFGESMRDLGIMDGDLVIAKETSTASLGDVVVAMIEGETTVKSLYIDGKNVELRPANNEFTSQYYPMEKVFIQGVVVALNRTF